MKVKYKVSVYIDDVEINGPKCPNWELTPKIEKRVNSIAEKLTNKALKAHRIKGTNFYADIIGLSDDGGYDCILSFDITGVIDASALKGLKLLKSSINKLESFIKEEVEEKLEYLKDVLLFANSIEATIKDWEIL